jgi:hypothetical protein
LEAIFAMPCLIFFRKVENGCFCLKRIVFSTSNNSIMDQKIPEISIKKAVGVAGGAVLLAPVGMPILHGICGIAVAGLGLLAAGTLVSKTVSALSANPTQQDPEDDSFSI